MTAPGAAPILVVGTTGDLATPYEWAEALAGQMESAVLITHEAAATRLTGRAATASTMPSMTT